MKKRKKVTQKKKKHVEEAPLWVKIFIVFIVILALLFLILNSMPGLSWYPGARFYDK